MLYIFYSTSSGTCGCYGSLKSCLPVSGSSIAAFVEDTCPSWTICPTQICVGAPTLTKASLTSDQQCASYCQVYSNLYSQYSSGTCYCFRDINDCLPLISYGANYLWYLASGSCPTTPSLLSCPQQKCSGSAALTFVQASYTSQRCASYCQLHGYQVSSFVGTTCSCFSDMNGCLPVYASSNNVYSPSCTPVTATTACSSTTCLYSPAYTTTALSNTLQCQGYCQLKLSGMFYAQFDPSGNVCNCLSNCYGVPSSLTVYIYAPNPSCPPVTVTASCSNTDCSQIGWRWGPASSLENCQAMCGNGGFAYAKYTPSDPTAACNCYPSSLSDCSPQTVPGATIYAITSNGGVCPSRRLELLANNSQVNEEDEKFNQNHLRRN